MEPLSQCHVTHRGLIGGPRGGACSLYDRAVPTADASSSICGCSPAPPPPPAASAGAPPQTQEAPIVHDVTGFTFTGQAIQSWGEVSWELARQHSPERRVAELLAGAVNDPSPTHPFTSSASGKWVLNSPCMQEHPPLRRGDSWEGQEEGQKQQGSNSHRTSYEMFFLSPLLVPTNRIPKNSPPPLLD